MYLKIMDAENAPDDDSRKTYRLLADVTAVKFSRVSDVGEGPEVGTFAFVRFKGGEPETFDVPGNAYVMNENGKTISSWGSHPFVAGEFPAATPSIESELGAVLVELADNPTLRSGRDDVIRRALETMKRRAP